MDRKFLGLSFILCSSEFLKGKALWRPEIETRSGQVCKHIDTTGRGLSGEEKGQNGRLPLPRLAHTAYGRPFVCGVMVASLQNGPRDPVFLCLYLCVLSTPSRVDVCDTRRCCRKGSCVSWGWVIKDSVASALFSLGEVVLGEVRWQVMRTLKTPGRIVHVTRN